jgi:hypothetical protein
VVATVGGVPERDDSPSIEENTMTEDTADRGSRRRRVGWAIGLLAAGAIGGGAIALTAPGWADPSAGASPAASGSPGRPAADPGGGGQRSDETLLAGADADKAKAAALAAVPGGTVDRVETDADGAVYEAHMTKSDGTKVTVKFDANFSVTAIQDGMGTHK